MTPFTDDGAVDWPALTALVEWQVAEGIDFIVACGTTGEAQTLTDDERVQVVAASRQAVAGRVPVMAGATSNDTRRAVEEVRRMCDAGADVILTASPYYNRPTQDGLRRHFEAVADASARPVVLYNVPGRAGVNLLPATAVALAAHANVDRHQGSGRRHAPGARAPPAPARRLSRLLRRRLDGAAALRLRRRRPHLRRLQRAAARSHRTGAPAPAPASWPPPATLLWKLMPLLDANFIESNPIPVKAALAMMGRIRNVLRLPLVPAQPATIGAAAPGTRTPEREARPNDRHDVAGPQVAHRALRHRRARRARNAPRASRSTRCAMRSPPVAVRAAQRNADGEWHANSWVKAGILLGFRLGAVVPVAEGGPVAFFDKDTWPLRKLRITDGIRMVPGGSAIRDGAYVARSVVCMPPMYINVGAYVDEGTMVDSHALVGSCAQIGKRVHLSAAAQMGGVLEPANALPVIIEDDAMIGGNCGVYEGTLVRERAVLAPGVILTGSTPVYDLVHGRDLSPGRRTPAGDPSGRRGGAWFTSGAHRTRGRRRCASLCPGHREVPRRAHRCRGEDRGTPPLGGARYSASRTGIARRRRRRPHRFALAKRYRIDTRLATGRLRHRASA